MQTLIREHANFVWGVVGGIATILGLLFAILPNFRAILEAGWLWGWALVILLVIACVLVWHIEDRSLQRSEAEISNRDESLKTKSDDLATLKSSIVTLKETLASERAALTSSISEIENTLATERQEKAAIEADLASARTQIRSLQRPVATERDKQLFDRLCTDWPPNQGTLYWLKSSFSGKSWSSETSRQVVDFAEIERETRFDDGLVNTSFTKFRNSCEDLAQWLTGNSFPSEVNPSMQVVPVRGSSEEHFNAFEAIRAEGMTLAGRVIANWRTLERNGRDRRL